MADRWGTDSPLAHADVKRDRSAVEQGEYLLGGLFRSIEFHGGPIRRSLQESAYMGR
jgi:hypothetical protein